MTGGAALLPDGENREVYAAGLPVELLAAPAEETIAGEPRYGSRVLGQTPAGELGVWELRGGTVSDVEVDEVFVVLSGNATIEFLDEDRAVTIGAGDVMRLTAGSRTRWTVADHLRKVYLAWDGPDSP